MLRMGRPRAAAIILAGLLCVLSVGRAAAMDAGPVDAPGDTVPTGGLRSLVDDSAPVRMQPSPVVRLGSPADFAGVDMYSTRGDYRPVGARDAGGGASLSGDSLTCLAQAVYYEARSESTQGQEAVAQVVLNRLRLANYPKTVCGVVYQGGERATGCQFTFVCDGSMRRPIEPAAWTRALAIAGQALGGFVYQPMLQAAHYHASWMTPYWSGSLQKIQQIGGHVFYR